MEKIRTRFAPSPTGYMHIGNLRTALYAYLIAKHTGGDFILRVEDTDQKRLVNDAMKIIYDSLEEVGIIYDEGPGKEGNCGPYTQSERLPIYKEYAEKLIELGGAHYCFCENKEYVDDDSHTELKDDPCKYLSKEEIDKKLSNGDEYVIRQTIEKEGTVEFVDAIYGTTYAEKRLLDEGVLLKSDGFPTYNFANVIDDHLMRINCVVRGNEYLSSTPKYNVMYEKFNWEKPMYIHLPPVMKDEHAKLSKRNGDASFNDLVKKGYLPEAILNYITLLGWAPPTEEEIYSLEELVKVFTIDRISKSPAIFDIEKLRWMNGVYIRNKSLEEFNDIAKKYYSEWIINNLDILELSKTIQNRTEVLTDIPEMTDFFEKLPEYDNELYINKKMKTDLEISKTALDICYKELSAFDKWNNFDELHNFLLSLAEKYEMKNGQILWPLRVALSGKLKTPGGAVEIAYLLGKDESLRRIQEGIKKVS